MALFILDESALLSISDLYETFFKRVFIWVELCDCRSEIFLSLFLNFVLIKLVKEKFFKLLLLIFEILCLNVREEFIRYLLSIFFWPINLNLLYVLFFGVLIFNSCKLSDDNSKLLFFDFLIKLITFFLLLLLKIWNFFVLSLFDSFERFSISNWNLFLYLFKLYFWFLISSEISLLLPKFKFFCLFLGELGIFLLIGNL